MEGFASCIWRMVSPDILTFTWRILFRIARSPVRQGVKIGRAFGHEYLQLNMNGGKTSVELGKFGGIMHFTVE